MNGRDAGSDQAAWSHGVLREVAAVLADTDDGLTGRAIGDLLARLSPDPPTGFSGGSGLSLACSTSPPTNSTHLRRTG